MSKPKLDYATKIRNQYSLVSYEQWIHHKGICPICGKSVEWIGFAGHMSKHRRNNEIESAHNVAQTHKEYHGC